MKLIRRFCGRVRDAWNLAGYVVREMRDTPVVIKCACCEETFPHTELLRAEVRKDARPHDSANATCPLCYVGLEVDDDYAGGARCGQDICYCNPP